MQNEKFKPEYVNKSFLSLGLAKYTLSVTHNVQSYNSYKATDRTLCVMLMVHSVIGNLQIIKCKLDDYSRLVTF